MILLAQITAVAHTAKQLIMDYFIAPPFCSYCKRFLSKRTVFCVSCEQKIIPVVSITCPLTKTKSMQVFAISGYCEPIKSLILAKSRSDIVASRKLGELLWSMTNIQHKECDYIIPIPLHWTRYAKRGFNQAEEMATIIGRKKNKPVIALLRRTKKTPFQSSLPTSERQGNVASAFIIDAKNQDQYRGKHLILVDDLMTTGSTLQEAARELLKLKPASISAVVAARIT